MKLRYCRKKINKICNLRRGKRENFVYFHEIWGEFMLPFCHEAMKVKSTFLLCIAKTQIVGFIFISA